MTYLRLTKTYFKIFMSIIKIILTLIQKIYTSDVKFNWQSFSKFAIDLRSLTRIEIYSSTKIVWTIKFSNFLTLTCNNLIFYSRLKLSSEIECFSNHCSLRKKRWRRYRCRCHLIFSCIYLKDINFFRSCIAT